MEYNKISILCAVNTFTFTGLLITLLIIYSTYSQMEKVIIIGSIGVPFILIGLLITRIVIRSPTEKKSRNKKIKSFKELPSTCPICNAPISRETLIWHSEKTGECPECGNIIKLR